MSDHTCEVTGNKLVISGNFSRDVETDLDTACQTLLAAGDKQLHVDAVGMTSICSTYVGLLAELALGAQGRGKSLLIRAGGRVAGVLDEAGLGSVATIERV